MPGPIPTGLRDATASVGGSESLGDGPHQPVSSEEARWQGHTERMSQFSASGSGAASGRLDLRADIPPFRPFSLPGGNALDGRMLGSGAIPNAGHAASGGLRDLPPPPTGQPPTGHTDLGHSAAGHTAAGHTELGHSGLHQGVATEIPHQADAQSASNAAMDMEDRMTADSSNAAGIRTGGSVSWETELGNQRLPAGGDFVPAQHASHPSMPSRSHIGIQVHNRYLVTQDEEGMVVVDQHALHERILYEQLRQRAESGRLESQKLLMPEPIDLTPPEAAAALEFREVLAKIGIEVEAFGGDTILMTSYPAMLANMRPAEVLRQVLEPLMSGGHEPSARDILDELLHMLACKAAVKAGDRLSPDEITALLEQRYQFQDTHHCPHGRPTVLHFSRQQLDKMFKRT